MQETSLVLLTKNLQAACSSKPLGSPWETKFLWHFIFAPKSGHWSPDLSLGQHGGRFSRVSVGKAIQISSLKVVETISITISSFFFHGYK